MSTTLPLENFSGVPVHPHVSASFVNLVSSSKGFSAANLTFFMCLCVIGLIHYCYSLLLKTCIHNNKFTNEGKSLCARTVLR